MRDRALRDRAATYATYGLVLVLAVELALWESFLVAARPFGVALPVSAALAAVGNVVLGLAGARVQGHRFGAVVPFALWLTIALALAPKRAEGDLVIPATFRGLAFLLVGTVAGAAVIGSGRTRVASGPTPGGPDGR